MTKKFLIESRRDFRFSLYSRDENIGLGHTYSSVIKKLAIDRAKGRNKIKVMSI